MSSNSFYNEIIDEEVFGILYYLSELYKRPIRLFGEKKWITLQWKGHI